MPSSLTWLDHDTKARERSLRILGLFEERDTREELGLGGIRDGLADLLFPGTTTIQTRLRYIFFVPWLYQALEREEVPAAEFAARARRRELELVQPLLRADEHAGVFGKRAGNTLKRLPSSVYWAALRSWGIRRFDGGQEDYHRAVEHVYRRRAQLARRDEGEQEPVPGDLAVTWHPRLPKAPPSFPERVKFDLTRPEADFLVDLIIKHHPASLLAHLALHGKPASIEAPWEHPQRAGFTAHHERILEHARRLAVVMRGAALVYNLALAELRQHDRWIAGHRQELDGWARAVKLDDVRAWDLDDLWLLLEPTGHAITYPTRAFVAAWRNLVLEGPRQIAESPLARELVEHRERQLKGPRSRYTSARAREQWSGSAGLRPFVYRWPNVAIFLDDLYRATGKL